MKSDYQNGISTDEQAFYKAISYRRILGFMNSMIMLRQTELNNAKKELNKLNSEL
jgi:UDP-3-O-acyl-N-acetylglucosamine deacetylase